VPARGDPDPLDVAVRALRYHDRSAQDVAERLERAGFDDARRAAALEELIRLGYVDDARYAARRAATLTSRGWGDAGIRARLEADGIGASEIDAAIDELPPERDRAAAILAREGRSPTTLRRLAAKGFATDTLDDNAGGIVARGGVSDV
jgi:SOS response regulatory protein OraA/RecX